MAAIAEEVDKERREKQAETQRETKGKKAVKAAEAITQKIVEQPRQEKEAAHKAAELFNTNRTYVNNAVKMKSS